MKNKSELNNKNVAGSIVVLRKYQQTISETATKKNTLVVLGTGSGKTLIFVNAAINRLKEYPNSKIVLLGPTRPLISQYKEVFEKFTDIPSSHMDILTGNIKPEKRAEMWVGGKIIFSTPQGLVNDLKNNTISLKDISLLGIDEGHRASKGYAYVEIAKKYMETAENKRILAMTASPGSNKDKIKEVCKNLFIEEIEYRSNEDEDMKPYIPEVQKNNIYVELTEEMKEVKKYLEKCYKLHITQMKTLNLDTEFGDNLTKTELLLLQKTFMTTLRFKRDFQVMKAVSLCAGALKVQHALELIETQGVKTLQDYIGNLQSDTTKAAKNLLSEQNFINASNKVEELVRGGHLHPKLIKLKELLQKDRKVIIFNQFRNSASNIVEEINKVKRVTAKLFIGQQKKEGLGMSQKEQISMIKEFGENNFNTLVATCVAEEGLDIPKVDEVIFYEPIPSAIRTIQRGGRTGRLEKGVVTILITKNTRDEGYYWSAIHKEKRMYQALKDIKENLEHNPGIKPGEGAAKKEERNAIEEFL